jgi:hypothetical protein
LVCSLFSGVEGHTGSSTWTDHPGLFDPAIHIFLCNSALHISKTLFSNCVVLSPFPTTPELPIADALVSSVYDVTLDLLPSGTIVYGINLSQDNIRPMMGSLLDWIRQSLTTLCDPLTISSGEIDGDDLLWIIHALGFVYRCDPESSDNHHLYKGVLCTFSVLSVHRYCAAVLQPLTSCLGKELGRHHQHLKPICDRLEKVMRLWVNNCNGEDKGQASW